MNYEDRLTLESLQAMVPKIVCGTYQGDNNESQFINLGFTPRAVYVCDTVGHTVKDQGSSYEKYYQGGLALRDNPIVGSGHTVLQIAEGGFMVYNFNATHLSVNTNVGIHYYIAIA